MDLSNKGLKKLPPLPEKVGNFNCSCNKLSNLIGSPKEVMGNFNCGDNRLTNLIGAPKEVMGNFYCGNNKLTSLFGAPKIIKGELYSRFNPKLIDVSDIYNSDIGDGVYFDLNPRMAILPLIIFKKLRCGNNSTINKICGRNRGNSKLNIINFQFDLIENGFADNARWKPITG